MEQAQALAVVRSLANGVDPETGEVFPAESAYQRPLVVRALYEAASALERMERFQRRKSQLPAKTGEPWTEEEDRKLLAAFDAGRALQELDRKSTRLNSNHSSISYAVCCSKKKKGVSDRDAGGEGGAGSPIGPGAGMHRGAPRGRTLLRASSGPR